MDLDGNTVFGGTVEKPESSHSAKEVVPFVRFIPAGNGGDTWRKMLYLNPSTYPNMAYYFYTIKF